MPFFVSGLSFRFSCPLDMKQNFYLGLVYLKEIIQLKDMDNLNRIYFEKKSKKKVLSRME